MSGLEILAVVACVAAVVSAFNDGNAIVKSIKAKRNLKKASLPSNDLADSLERGPPAVEAEKKLGIDRFGKIFAQGDQIAVNQLKDIIIDLQTSLLTHLRQAQEDDSLTDFTVLIDASNIGRGKAVGSLVELYMRLATAAPIQGAAIPSTSPPNFTNDLVGQIQERAEYKQAGGTSNQDLERRRKFLNISFSSKKSSRPTKVEGRIRDVSPAPTSLKSASIEAIKELNQDIGTLSTGYENNSQSLSNEMASLPVASELDENPWLELSTSGTNSHQTPDAESIVCSLAAPLTSARSIVVEPSARNNYGGFCKGSFNLQVGSENALIRRKQMGPVQSMSFFWGCSYKCAFAGAALHNHGEWGFDNTVKSFHGIRYRWIFLAKSHVTQSRVKNGIYIYKCIFCVLQAIDTPVFQRISSFMEHLSIHRGQQFGEAILHRTSCISDRVADEKENFDINLTPLVTE